MKFWILKITLICKCCECICISWLWATFTSLPIMLAYMSLYRLNSGLDHGLEDGLYSVHACLDVRWHVLLDVAGLIQSDHRWANFLLCMPIRDLHV